MLAPAFQANAILLLGAVGSVAAILASRRLKTNYIQTLEDSLLHRADGAAEWCTPRD